MFGYSGLTHSSAVSTYDPCVKLNNHVLVSNYPWKWMAEIVLKFRSSWKIWSPQQYMFREFERVYFWIIEEFELTSLVGIAICLNLACHIGVDYIIHCSALNESIIFQVKDLQALASFPQASFRGPKQHSPRKRYVTRALRLCCCCLHYHPTRMNWPIRPLIHRYLLILFV